MFQFKILVLIVIEVNEHLKIYIITEMRSSFSSATNIQSKLSTFGSMSFIRLGQNAQSKQSKVLVSDELGHDFQKLFNNAITEKDLADIKKIGYIYKKYQNGDTYLGQMDNNQKVQVQGIYIFNNGTDRNQYFYKGGFQNGEFSGFGKFCKMINDKQAMYIYQGYWKYGRREGQGKQNYNIQNNLYYRGSFVNDQRHGFGTMTMPVGYYEGKWQFGQMNGQGTFVIERGPLKNVITGKWLNDIITEGKIEYFSKPSNQLKGTYKGKIKDLCRHGQGLYQVGNSVIQGNFVNDQLVGQNTLRKTEQPYQYILKGDLNQLQNFTSTIKYTNTNDQYQGKVQITPNHIIRRTQGKYYFGTGDAVEGQFQDNNQGNLIFKKK